MSTATPARMELRIPRRPEYVRMARRTTCALAAQLDFTYDVIKDIELAVGEACTNAVRHVERARSEEILVRFTVESRRLVIEVIDYGQGFEPEEEGGEGLGLMVMRSVMDEVDIQCQADSGTCVRMVKYRSGP